MIVRSEKVREFEELSEKQISIVENKSFGILQYTLHRSHKDPCQYTSIQCFSDRAALKNYANSSVIDQRRKQFDEFFVVTPAIEICDLIVRHK